MRMSMRKNICLGVCATLAFAVSVCAQEYKINKVGSNEEQSFNVFLNQIAVTQAAAGSWIDVTPVVPDGKVFKGFTVYDEYGMFPNQQRVSTTTKEDTRFLMPDHDVYVKASYETLRYYLIVNSTDNGKVLVTFDDRTRDRTKPGTKVTVTPNPADGYTVESIVVSKKQEDSVLVDCVKDPERTDGSCNFDMPHFDVVVSANFVSLTASSSSAEVVSSSSAIASSSSVVESSSAAAPASSSDVAPASSSVESSSSVAPASSSSVVVASSSSVAPSSSSAVPASSSAVVASSSSVAPASSSSVVASSSSVAPASSAVASSSSAAPASSSSVKASSSSAAPASSSSVKASSSSAKPASSSSVKASSSSAKPASSSSVKASSSSAKPASSSSVKASSSSAKPASSSSKKNSSSSVADVVVESVATEEDLPSCTVKRENMTYYVSTLKAVFVCKSRMWSRYNPGPNFIPTIARTPKFAAVVNGRSLQISGATVGSQVSLFDLQGRVMYNGRAESANFTMSVVRSGTFLLRVGTQQKVINIR